MEKQWNLIISLNDHFLAEMVEHRRSLNLTSFRITKIKFRNFKECTWLPYIENEFPGNEKLNMKSHTDQMIHEPIKFEKLFG